MNHRDTENTERKEREEFFYKYSSVISVPLWFYSPSTSLWLVDIEEGAAQLVFDFGQGFFYFLGFDVEGIAVEVGF